MSAPLSSRSERGGFHATGKNPLRLHVGTPERFTGGPSSEAVASTLRARFSSFGVVTDVFYV